VVVSRQHKFHNKHFIIVNNNNFYISYRLKDPSVLNDFFGETFSKIERLEQITLENCPAILAHCLTLVNSKY
jgi:hypothetical protein